ncbi:MAG: hypothetical protein K8J09_18260 [Planctomycetes bacterium]|nr:hypothetical protein [Planctomycetota bacterium]
MVGPHRAGWDETARPRELVKSMSIRTQNSELRTQGAARTLIAAIAASAAFAMGAKAQNDVFVTYDHTISPATPEPAFQFNEWWVDAKMPGGWPTTNVGSAPNGFPLGFPPTFDNRNSYVVGTIEVNTTQQGSFFSGLPAETGFGGPPFFLPLAGGAKRQVVMLQFNDVVANTNGPQRYFYGIDQQGNNTTRAANARAVSVWRGDNALADRIAICGETCDEMLPTSFGQAPWLNATATDSSGFLAVYDGTGAVLWTRHFFDPNNLGDQSCAITDISIRVDADGNDVVTYCGISSLGSPAGGEMAPLQPFLVSAPCNSGNAALPAGQWDGFVGRVVFDGANVNRVFHSVVGGPGQDGLFGIAEIDENRFVVVGSAQAAPNALGFPFTSTCGTLAGPYVLGAVLEFDATGLVVGGAGNLQLAKTRPLGNNLGPTGEIVYNTTARDVWIGRQIEDLAGLVDEVYVVGSTDDPAFSCQGAPWVIAPPTGQGTLQGATDGFIAVIRDDPFFNPLTFSYHGGPGRDGLVGINGWNEFSEHFTVVGFTDGNGGDIDVATYFFDDAIGGNPTNNSNQLLPIRQRQLDSGAVDRPAAVGDINATTVGLGWDEFGLGQPGGGGVAVGDDGRCNVVGTTTGAGIVPVGAAARAYDAVFEGIRVMSDMVPQGVNGVGRTDGTGFQAGVGGAYPPAAPYTGGTTPFCGLSEFGLRVGDPLPALQRMLIDVDGDVVVNSTNVAIIVSRPTTQIGSYSVGVLQFGFPPATPWAYWTGSEVWLGDPSATFMLFGDYGPNHAYRLPLGPLPLGGGPISAQLVCYLLGAPIAGQDPNCVSLWTASPAIWFNW